MTEGTQYGHKGTNSELSALLVQSSHKTGTNIYTSIGQVIQTAQASPLSR